MGEPLENDPANPCVGCGPANPMGLRLAFERDGEGARAAWLVRPEHAGMPERLHSGLLYLALAETANWALFAARGRVGLPVRTSALDARRFVAVGETLALVARPAGERAVAAEALDARGALVARLEREYVLPSRAEFMAKMGYTTLPAVYEGILPEAEASLGDPE